MKTSVKTTKRGRPSKRLLAARARMAYARKVLMDERRMRFAFGYDLCNVDVQQQIGKMVVRFLLKKGELKCR